MIVGFSKSLVDGSFRISQVPMTIVALGSEVFGIPHQNFVVKTTRKEKCAPFCALIDTVDPHEQQRTPLLRSIEGSAIALQLNREAVTYKIPLVTAERCLDSTWLSGNAGGPGCRRHRLESRDEFVFCPDYKPFLPLTSPPIPFFCRSPRPFGRPRLVRLPFFGPFFRAVGSPRIFNGRSRNGSHPR